MDELLPNAPAPQLLGYPPGTIAFSPKQLPGVVLGKTPVIHQPQLLHAAGGGLGRLPRGRGPGDLLRQLPLGVIPVLQQVQGLLLGPPGVRGLDELKKLLVAHLVPGLQARLEEHLGVQLYRGLPVQEQLNKPPAPGLRRRQLHQSSSTVMSMLCLAAALVVGAAGAGSGRTGSSTGTAAARGARAGVLS